MEWQQTNSMQAIRGAGVPCTGDTHTRVAAAAAGALSAAVAGCPATLEPHLPAFLHPLLAAAAVRDRPQLSEAAAKALSGAPPLPRPCAIHVRQLASCPALAAKPMHRLSTLHLRRPPADCPVGRLHSLCGASVRLCCW